MGATVVAAETVRLMRVWLLPPTLYVALLGGMTAASLPGVDVWALLVAVAVLAHTSDHIANDVFDRPFDEGYVRRRDSPLLRGVIGPGVALVLAAGCAVVALALSWLLAPPAATAWLVAHFVAALVYNGLHKRVAGQPLFDFFEGAAFGTLVGFGAAVAGGVDALAVGIVLYLLPLTAAHSGVLSDLYDLRHDLLTGARSTAVVLGARPDGDRIDVPARMWVYAMVMQLIGAVVLVVTAVRVYDDPAVLSAVVVLVIALATATLVRGVNWIATGRSRRWVYVHGYLVLSLLAPSLLVFRQHPAVGVAMFGVVLIAPAVLLLVLRTTVVGAGSHGEVGAETA